MNFNVINNSDSKNQTSHLSDSALQDNLSRAALNPKTGFVESMPDLNLSEALISKRHLIHNLNQIRSKIGPSCKIMGIVKANAYGHNVKEVSATLFSNGVRSFGVANINEAIELKQHFIEQQLENEPFEILAFASPLPEQLPFYLMHDIDLTLTNYETYSQAEAVAQAHNSCFNVHLKVDTGMGRLGVSMNDALELARLIERSPYLNLKSIYSHFASSGEDMPFSRQQSQHFKSLTREFEHSEGRKVLKHMANSGAIVSDHDTYYDMVRPGILLYGYTPSSAIKTSLNLKPVMQFQSRVTFIKWVEAGQTISYGRTWEAKKRTRIATISVGYADGYHRALSNNSFVEIHGKGFQQIGNVTMDQIMVSLGEDTSVNVGDVAVLFGWNGPKANELADRIGTIGYELLCSVSPRVKRVILED